MMKVEYIDHMGDDLTVVNAARVSMDKESQYEMELFLSEKEAEKSVEQKAGQGAFIDYAYVMSEQWYGTYPVKSLSEKDVRLISYLSKHGHWTPFSHPQIQLRYTVPIFCARQEFKHIVGFTRNEVSRRYVDEAPEFFTPDAWRKRADNVKQGSSTTETVTQIASTTESGAMYLDSEYAKFLRYAKGLYETMIENGVAPEQARMVLPQSMYTSYYITGSLAAFARFYRLRVDAHAQKEIQDLAGMVGEIIQPLFPVSWRSLTQ